MAQISSSCPTIKFVVGDGECIKLFEVQRDLFIDLSPVLEAGLRSGFKESLTNEFKLPQFDPSNFDLFLRLVQAISFSIPPLITVSFDDDLVIKIVPIAAYLGAQRVLKLLEMHVQQHAKLATILVFNENSVDVKWSHACIESLFEELTTKGSNRFPSSNLSNFKKISFSPFSKQKVEGLSNSTLSDLLCYAIERKCFEYTDTSRVPFVW